MGLDQQIEPGCLFSRSLVFIASIRKLGSAFFMFTSPQRASRYGYRGSLSSLSRISKLLANARTFPFMVIFRSFPHLNGRLQMGLGSLPQILEPTTQKAGFETALTQH